MARCCLAESLQCKSTWVHAHKVTPLAGHRDAQLVCEVVMR